MLSVLQQLSQETTTNSEQIQRDVRIPINRYVLFFLLASVGFIADILTKKYVFAQHFDQNDHGVSHWWVEDVFGIQTSFNGGALFGIFQGGSVWLAALSAVALIGILVWLFVYRMATSRFLTFALGLITGGILGNLFDRMGFGWVANHPEQTRYHVRDWIHVRFQDVPFFDPWPNFNIADSTLVCGALLLFFFAMFASDDGAKNQSKSP